MSALSLKSELLLKKQLILLSGFENPLKRETLRQLSLVPDVEVLCLNETDISFLENLEPTVIIHYVGFISPSYATAYSAMVYLHALLKIASKYNSRLILVVSDLLSEDCKSAVSLTTRFGNRFKLRFNVISPGSDSDYQLLATSVIKIFIYHYHAGISGQETHSQINRNRRVFKSQLLLCRNWLNKMCKPAFVLLSFIAGLYFCFLCQILLAGLYLNCSVNAFNRMDFNIASGCSNSSGILFSGMLFQSRYLPGTQKLSEYADLPLSQTGTLALSLNNLSHLVYNLEENFLTLLKPAGDISGVLEIVNNLPEKLSAGKAYIVSAKSHLEDYYRVARKPFPGAESLAENLNRLNLYLDKTILVSSLLPDFLGINKKVTYLVLRQDDARLFSAGGIVGSVEVLTIKDAEIVSTGSYKASVLENLLPGKIDAPADLSQLTGVRYWDFSQVGWNPDFSVSAPKAAWFVNKAVSVQPDVVIALTPRSLDQIADNLNKPSFYTTLMNLLETRQLFVYPLSFPASVNDSAGYSGRIMLPECRLGQTCFKEFVYQDDSDISRDGISASISRQDIIDIRLSTQRADTRLISTFDNPGQDSPISSASARIFRRIYIPSGSELTVSRLNGRQISPEVFMESSSSGILELGFIINVLPGSSSVLDLEYSKRIGFSGDSLNFQIDIPNQPGGYKLPLEIRVNYPPGWHATTNGNPQVASPGTLRYNTPSLRPAQININFTLN